MSAYKQFTTKDIVITPFSANKGFNYTGSAMTASNVGVEIYFGTQPPANKLIFETSTNGTWVGMAGNTEVSSSQNITGFVNKLNTNSVYSSAMQLYYSNYFGSMSGSLVATSSLLYGLKGERNNTFAANNNINLGLSGSNNMPIGAIKSPQYDNYLSSTITQTRTALLGEDLPGGGYTSGANPNYITVISIPSKLWGSNIEPQSFNLVWNLNSGGVLFPFNVWDDGDGNLRCSASWTSPATTNVYCGNISYEHGLAILTPVAIVNDSPAFLVQPNYALGALGARILNGTPGYKSTPNLTTGLGEVTVGWSSSVTLYEHQYKCVVRENEFGYSLNPSVLSGSQVNAPLGVNNVYKDFATGSYFSPYITTVGLYDNDQNLLAIGKLSVPTKVPMNADLEIQVAFDSL